MNNRYNRNTMSDMPMDSYFNGPLDALQENKNKKPKINAIGKKANNNLNQELEKNKKKSKDNVWSDEFKSVKKNHEENVRTYLTKTKRNRMVIVALIIMILISISVLGIYSYITSLEINCHMIVHGVNATYIVNGEEIDRFRAPSNLQGNRILELNIQIRIEDPGYYNIRFVPKCYQKNKLMQNSLIYLANSNLFVEGDNGYFYSERPIKGNQTISLCGGIILDYNYENTLNVNNFRLEFHTYFEAA